MNPTLDEIKRLLSLALPSRSVSHHEVLTGGLINTNIKVFFESHKPVVLRLYRDGADVCKREVAIHELVSKAIPVPRILHADPSHTAYAILEFVEAVTFQQLKQTGDLKAIQAASASIGKTLADIGRFHFPESGRLLADDNGLMVGDPFVEGTDPIPTLLDRFLSSPICERRLGSELSNRIHRFGWEWSARLPNLDERPALVHSDFGSRNILVTEQNGAWQVAAVLDWEFAFSGSPLLDVGHFLRYERMSQPLREPHFSQAFLEHGGQLPDNWREIVRVIDLTALVQCLTLENLPADVEAELFELIASTITR